MKTPPLPTAGSTANLGPQAAESEPTSIGDLPKEMLTEIGKSMTATSLARAASVSKTMRDLLKGYSEKNNDIVHRTAALELGGNEDVQTLKKILGEIVALPEKHQKDLLRRVKDMLDEEAEKAIEIFEPVDQSSIYTVLPQAVQALSDTLTRKALAPVIESAAAAVYEHLAKGIVGSFTSSDDARAAALVGLINSTAGLQAGLKCRALSELGRALDQLGNAAATPAYRAVLEQSESLDPPEQTPVLLVLCVHVRSLPPLDQAAMFNRLYESALKIPLPGQCKILSRLVELIECFPVNGRAAKLREIADAFDALPDREERETALKALNVFVETTGFGNDFTSRMEAVDLADDLDTKLRRDDWG